MLVRVTKKTKTAVVVKYAPSGGACAVGGELGAECGRGGRGGRARVFAPAAAQNRLVVTHPYEKRHRQDKPSIIRRYTSELIFTHFANSICSRAAPAPPALST